MASFYPAHISAVQVGTYFVGQYYQLLQQQPDLVHQFYANLSSMVRYDGAVTEQAVGMVQIHQLVMSLNYSGIEIKTAHSLESWSGGVLVMVSGYVQPKDYTFRRKFVQTFFLAPQEKGYFVLNDIFHFLEEEHILDHSKMILNHNNFEVEIIQPNSVPEPVSNHLMGEQIQTGEHLRLAQVEENGTINGYNIPEPLQPAAKSEEKNDEYHTAEEPPVPFPSAVSTTRDLPPALPEEPVGEQPKQTYASILRAKGQFVQSLPQRTSLNKDVSVASEISPQTNLQQSLPIVATEKFRHEAVEDNSIVEDEGESRSVYVKNLPPSISISELEQEFKNFGRLKPDGVAIRSRKEAGVFYAFIEFEDANGVQNAIKASPLELNERQIYVEGRRPNSGASRGRRGRGRGGYQWDAPRGRFGGGNFVRGSGVENNDGDYSNRPRVNGYHHRAPRQERGILGSQAPYASED